MTTALIAFVTSVVSSLLVWRFYINWQYHQSTAGFRLAKVIDATKYVIECNDEQIKKIEASSTHRCSLGPLLYSLAKKYEAADEGVLFCDEPDVWELYYKSIRPVITDINNNSFIGWLPGIPNVHRLLAVQRLCFAAESYIASLDRFRKLEEVGSVEHSRELDKCYGELVNYWKNWLKLVKEMK